MLSLPALISGARSDSFGGQAQEYVSSPPTAEETGRDPFEGRVDGLYLVLISLHGLVRGERMELGRDPDTGGQVRFYPVAIFNIAVNANRDERAHVKGLCLCSSCCTAFCAARAWSRTPTVAAR